MTKATRNLSGPNRMEAQSQQSDTQTIMPKRAIWPKRLNPTPLSEVEVVFHTRKRDIPNLLV